MGAEESVFMDSDLVIRPSVNDVGSAAFDQFDETERLGYEEAVKRSDGRTVYRTVSGPYKRDQICRTIEVQNEPGWVLKGYAI